MSACNVSPRLIVTHTPSDTTKDLSNEQCLNVVREEHEKDEAIHEEERDNHDWSIPPSMGGPAIDERTNDRTGCTPIGKSCLPRRGDLIAHSGPVVGAVFLLELRICPTVHQLEPQVYGVITYQKLPIKMVS